MILSEAVLSVLMLGMTHYVDIGKDSDAAIFYADSETAYMQLAPDQPVMVGAWSLSENSYHVAWQDGPEGSWSIDVDAGTFTYLDGDQQPRGTITRLVPGDAAGLVPQ